MKRGQVTQPEGNRVVVVRRRLMLACFVIATAVILGRTGQLALVQREEWLAKADQQHADGLDLPAPRGTIYDRNGTPLAASRDVYRIALAPREVKDRAALERALQEVAGLRPRDARKALDTRRRWVVLSGRFDAEVREALEGVAGVHFETVQQRFYPHGTVAIELIGRVNAEGTALGGLELELNDLLTGKSGRAFVRRDSRGALIPGAMVRSAEPVTGHDVYLTIDAELQAIADEALRLAIDSTQAEGGEFLLADPYTGEILAAASRGANGATRNWRAVTAPYEPGSTLKPFAVAALLAAGRASMSDSVFAEEGRWQQPGRTISDVHGYGWISVATALEKSSNIALAKLAGRLDPAVQYQYLRDFGFGSPTAVTYPSESGGRLRHPEQWTRYSHQSLAIGYEISVTPLQMVLAYGALANGGELYEPKLVREVRTRDGKVQQESAPRVVRRVIPRDVAEQIREVLVGVVEEGTGQAAALGPFSVAGKTGTVRIAAGGRYVPGAYTASFAGFFPAEDPQLVFLAKLDRPRGDYYGGLAAAPITRTALEAALAARNTPIDKSAVALAASPLPEAAAGVAVAPARLTQDAVRYNAPRTSFVLNVHAVEARAAGDAEGAVSKVPDVGGLALRDAVRALHAAGFRVQLSGVGAASETQPPAGELVREGSVVHVRGGGE